MSYQDEHEDQAIARAFALDDDNEAAMDRAVVEDYQRVLSYLPFEEVEPPAELEDRVVAAALAARPATVRNISSARRARRRATARWATLGAAVAAAAAVVGFMVVTSNDAKPTPGGSVELAGAGHQAVRAPILEQPGTRKGDLIDMKGAMRGKAALATNGDGVLYDLETLPAPPPGEYLWVWLDTGEKVIPIGTLETFDFNSNDPVPFHVTGDVGAVKAVKLSRETTTAPPDTTGKQEFVATAALS
jgi:hypothetical protein